MRKQRCHFDSNFCQATKQFDLRQRGKGKANDVEVSIQLGSMRIHRTLRRATAAQTKLYWTDPNLGIIKRCNLDGSTVETVLNTGEDIAYLTAANSLGRIYYSIGSPVPQLWSADFAGQNRRLLDTFDTANYTRALAFNPADSKLYWSSSHGYVAGNGKIRSANNNGLNVTDILTLSERYPYGLAIDPTAGKMYWIDTVDEKRIERANLDGTARETVINGSVGFTGQITLDPIGQKLYWVDSEHGLVERRQFKRHCDSNHRHFLFGRRIWNCG